MMEREKTLLHVSFAVGATLIVFWIGRVTIPAWIVLPALSVVIAAPWLQRHRLTWEAIIGVALLSVFATNSQRLAIDYAARYREFFFLVVPMLFYAGIVFTRVKPPGEPVYLYTVTWLGLLAALDPEGASVTIPALSALILLAVLLSETAEDRPRLLLRLVPVAVILIAVTILSTFLAVETGPLSASTARNLQAFLFGRSTSVDFVLGHHGTNWWRPWPSAGTRLLRSWLVRLSFVEESADLGRSLLIAPFTTVLAWIFVGGVLQQGPGKSFRKLLPSFVLTISMGLVFLSLISLHSKSLSVLMLGPASPWMVNGNLLVPTSWQMFLALRAKVNFFPSSSIIVLQLVVRNLSILAVLFSVITSVRQAFATQWDRLEGIGRRRDRIVIERTIKRIRSLDDDELLRDPRGTIIALFYMAANALYPLDLAMVRGETPTELSARVARWYPDIAEQIDILGKLFYVARYSEAEITTDQVRQARSAYEKLLNLLKAEAQHPRIKTEGALPSAQ
ncbi:DUF4129 domain-containing protein [bacterium]|nr:DUF4129 domain-containing protein [bacterium]